MIKLFWYLSSPNSAGKHRLEQALDNSMKRMGVEYLDLYLYHWRGNYPLEETVAELDRVKKQKDQRMGRFNFEMLMIWKNWQIPEGRNCLVNQVLYHVGSEA